VDVVAVTVAPGVERELEGEAYGPLLIRSADEPSRVAAAVDAAANDIYGTGLLRRTGELQIAGEVIRPDGTRWRPTDQELEDNELLRSLNGPASVFGPIPVPGGQLLVIDYKDTPPELRRETPRLLVHRLEAAGVRDAEICFPPLLSGDRLVALRSFSPVVRAYLRTSAGPPSAGWFRDIPSAPRLTSVAAEWLRRHHVPGMDLLALVAGTAEVPLTWDSLRPAAGDVLAADVSIDLIVSDFAARAATAQLGFFGYTGITLAAAGRDWRGEQAAAQMRALREIIRACGADLDWAGVDVYPSTECAQSGGKKDVLDNAGVYYRDEFHADPMWYQVLSHAQLQRLGAPPPGAAGLADSRFELTTGEPEQWVPGHPDNAAIRARASKLLATDTDPGALRPGRRKFWRRRP
jgi:hypothetical protein